MKYLRKYNESVGLENDILDICHSKLAYVLDDSRFKVEILSPGNGSHYKVKLDCEDNRWFGFSEIRDHYIDFVRYLDLKIGIDHNFFRTPGLVVEFATFHTSTYATIDELEDIEVKSSGVSVYIKK
jgi:hypothetical protein